MLTLHVQATELSVQTKSKLSLSVDILPPGAHPTNDISIEFEIR